jgi:hypothetical protein
MWGVLELGLANARIKCDTIMGFGVDKFSYLLRKENMQKHKVRDEGQFFWTMGD